MTLNSKCLIGTCAFLFLIAAVAVRSEAAFQALTVDEILFPNGENPTSPGLAGTVEMQLVGTTLSIRINNTSPGDYSSADIDLLTGVGFSLPSGVTVVNPTLGIIDTAINAGSIATQLARTNVDDQWGIGDASSGHFGTASVATLVYNFIIGTITADRDILFDGSASSIDGPDYGLLGPVSTVPNSKNGIRGPLTVNLSLSGLGTAFDTQQELFDFIQANAVGIEFASPTTGGSIKPNNGQVPEPATAVLAGLGGLGLAVARWRKRKPVKVA